MNRLMEYYELIEELEETPMELEYSVTRAKERLKKRKKIRSFIVIPSCVFSSILLVFVTLVNVSPQFVEACEKIPIVDKIARLAFFSNTLREAVEHEYDQNIDLMVTENDITLNIEYLIADESNLYVFYNLESDKEEYQEKELYLQPRALTSNGVKIKDGYITSMHKASPDENALNVIEYNFYDGNLPEQLRLVGVVFEEESEMLIDENTQGKKMELARFSVDLPMDQSRTEHTQLLEVNQDIEIEGQLYTIKDVRISPFKLQIEFQENMYNNNLLKGLDLYIEDENGERYHSEEEIENENGSILTYQTESPFFTDAKELTLVIEGAALKERNYTPIELDLEFKRRGYSVYPFCRNQGLNSSSLDIGIIQDRFREEFGDSYWEEIIRICSEYPACSIEVISMEACPDSNVYILPRYTSRTRFKEEMRIKIK